VLPGQLGIGKAGDLIYTGTIIYASELLAWYVNP
jgi:hypothetical protein